MDQMIESTVSEEMLPDTARAIQITERIKANGRLAVNAVCLIGKDLRTMKIDKLYTTLGYEEFEEYAEKEFQLKRRQAYQYISVYEKLGEDFVQSNAQLGITKLSLLATVNPEDRADIMKNEDVSGMTSKELEELISKCKEQGEQLKNACMDTNNLMDSNEALKKELEDFRKKCAEQESRIEQLESVPKDVEIQEREVIKEIPDKATKEKLDKKINELLRANAEKEKVKNELNALTAEKQVQEQTINRMKKEIEELKKANSKTSDSADKSSFKAMLTSTYKEITGLVEFVKNSEPDERMTFIKKAFEVLNMGKDALKGIDPCIKIGGEEDEQ